MRSEWNNRKPAWWLLYVIGLLLTGLIGLVEATVSAGGPRTILELALAILVVGLMLTWVRHNRAAMELEDVQRHRQP